MCAALKITYSTTKEAEKWWLSAQSFHPPPSPSFLLSISLCPSLLSFSLLVSQKHQLFIFDCVTFSVRQKRAITPEKLRMLRTGVQSPSMYYLAKCATIHSTQTYAHTHAHSIVFHSFFSLSPPCSHIQLQAMVPPPEQQWIKSEKE